MLILTIRSDKPDAEVGLYVNTKQIRYETWLAHRELAETIHTKIRTILDEANKSLGEIEGVVIFMGPGSFTGLRIGISVANAVAYGLKVPIIGGMGEQWLNEGIKRLTTGENDQMIVPEYGADPHITQQKK